MFKVGEYVRCVDAFRDHEDEVIHCAVYKISAISSKDNSSIAVGNARLWNPSRFISWTPWAGDFIEGAGETWITRYDIGGTYFKKADGCEGKMVQHQPVPILAKAPHVAESELPIVCEIGKMKDGQRFQWESSVFIRRANRDAEQGTLVAMPADDGYCVCQWERGETWCRFPKTEPGKLLPSLRGKVATKPTVSEVRVNGELLEHCIGVEINGVKYEMTEAPEAKSERELRERAKAAWRGVEDQRHFEAMMAKRKEPIASYSYDLATNSDVLSWHVRKFGTVDTMSHMRLIWVAHHASAAIVAHDKRKKWLSRSWK